MKGRDCICARNVSTGECCALSFRFEISSGEYVIHLYGCLRSLCPIRISYAKQCLPLRKKLLGDVSLFVHFILEFFKLVSYGC